MNKEMLQEAIEIFGEDVVNEVIELVSVSDSDGVWSLFEDMGKYDHMECVEMLYFEQ